MIELNNAVESDSSEVDNPSPHFRRFMPDVLAIGLLLALAGVAIGFLWRYDMWLYRIDLQQQLIPYYGFLGDQLRHWNVPGWNPHQLSGLPFAGDPLSGWTQWPVMLFFTLLGPIWGMKALIGFNLILAAVATYAYCRCLEMSIPASFTGAVSFGLGASLISFNTYCCNIMGNYAPWVPVALLGIELAVRRRRLVERAAAVCLLRHRAEPDARRLGWARHLLRRAANRKLWAVPDRNLAARPELELA